MTAKELLERIIKIRKAIDYRKTKIDALVAQAENTSCRLTGMPHNPSPDTSPMATAICKKVDLEREIETLEAERNAHIAKIDILEDEFFTALARYVQEANGTNSENGLLRTHITIARTAVQIRKKLKDGSKWQ